MKKTLKIFYFISSLACFSFIQAHPINPSPNTPVEHLQEIWVNQSVPRLWIEIIHAYQSSCVDAVEPDPTFDLRLTKLLSQAYLTFLVQKAKGYIDLQIQPGEWFFSRSEDAKLLLHGLTYLNCSTAIIYMVHLMEAPLDLQDQQGSTPVELALQLGNLNSLQALLELGARQCTTSPTHWAAKHNQLEILKLLFKKGWSIQTPDADGNNPYLIAADCHGSNSPCAKWLINKMTYPLHAAAKQGNLKELQDWVALYPNQLNSLNPKGQTPLTVALVNRQETCLSFLLSKRAQLPPIPSTDSSRSRSW